MKSIKSLGRIALPVGILIVLFLLIVFVFKPLYGEINRRIEVLKTELISGIENTIGRPITYGSISPSLFRVIEIRDLTIHGRDEAGTEVLVIKKVRIYYNLLTLLFKDPAESFRQIKIEDTHLVLDTEKDTELIKTVADLLQLGKKDTASEIQFDHTFTVTGNNLSVALISPDWNASMEQLFFRIKLNPESVSLEGKGNLSGSFTLDPLEPVTGSGRIELTGDAAPDFSWTNITLSFNDLESNLFKITDQTYDIDFQEGRNLVLRKIGDNLPIDLELTVNPQDQSGAAVFQTDRFVPSDLITFRGFLESLNPWLDTAVTGSGQASFSEEDGINYTMDFAESALDVAKIADNFPLEDKYTFSGFIEGNEEQASFENLEITSSAGTINYTGSIGFNDFTPEGFFKLTDVKLDPYPVLSAEIAVNKEGRSYLGKITDLNYGGIPVSSLNISVTPAEEQIHLLLQGSFGDTVNHTRISGAYFPESKDLTIDGKITGIKTSVLREIGLLVLPGQEIPELPGAAENSRTTAQVNLSITPARLNAEVPKLLLYNPGEDSQRLLLAGSYDGSKLKINRIKGSWNDITITGNGSADFSAEEIHFSSDFTLREIPYSIDGTYVKDQGLTVTGLHGVQASFSLGRGNEIFVEVKGENIPLPLGNESEESYVSAEFFGIFYSPTEYEMRVNKLILKNLPFVPGEDSFVSLSGSISNGTGDFSEVTFSDTVSRMTGTGSAAFILEKEYSIESAFRLEGPADQERIAGSIRLTPDLLSIKSTLRNTRIERLGEENLTGLLSGNLSLNKKGKGEPELSAVISLEKGAYKETSLSGKGAFQYKDKLFTASDLEGSISTHRFRTGEVVFRLETGDISGNLGYTGNFGGENLDLSASFEGKAAPVSLSAIDTLIRSPFNIDARIEGIPFGQGGPEDIPDGTPEPWDIYLTRKDSLIRVNGGPDDCIRGFLEEGGNFQIVLSDPLPVNFDAQGSFIGSEIEANLNRITFDIKSISSYLNLGFLHFLTGNTSGSLRVTGPVNDPDFYGTITITDATADLAIFPDIAGPATIHLVFQEKNLNLKRFKANVDGRSGYIDGAFMIDHWTPGEFRLNIESEEKEGINVVYNFGGLSVDGYARGELSISGNSDYILLEGDITADSTIMTVGEAPPKGSGDEPYDIYLDLILRSGRGVEFLWPSRNFPILRSFAETNQSLHITYESISESFGVNGDIGIKGGEIFYFQRSFYIKEGYISFNEDESAFDPRLAARAELREATSEGTAKINLIVDESRLSEFSPRFESDPPMSDAEIAALLGGSLFSDSQGGNELSSALFLTSDIIGQFGFMRSFERTLRNALNLDLFSIRTHLFENVVRGIMNDPLDNNMLSLGKYLDNTTLFLGKYIGSDLFLEMLIQLRTNQLGTGAGAFSGLQVDSEFSLEWKTPFFLLEWEFLPRHPENLFITDNKLSFSWKFSF
ncbi:MAG: translocation/assembly module TamB domain-containing protein [Spirochaetia bacterium]